MFSPLITHNRCHWQKGTIHHLGHPSLHLGAYCEDGLHCGE